MPRTADPTKKKKNKQDATLINVDAAKHRDEKLDARIDKLEAQMKAVAKLLAVEGEIG